MVWCWLSNDSDCYNIITATQHRLSQMIANFIILDHCVPAWSTLEATMVILWYTLPPLSIIDHYTTTDYAFLNAFKGVQQFCPVYSNNYFETPSNICVHLRSGLNLLMISGVRNMDHMLQLNGNHYKMICCNSQRNNPGIELVITPLRPSKGSQEKIFWAQFICLFSSQTCCHCVTSIYTLPSYALIIN